MAFRPRAFRLPALLTSLCLITSPLAANQDPDRAVADFTGLPGWVALDSETLEILLDDKMESSATAMRPSGELSALEKTLLMLEMTEAPLDRTRTILRYGQITFDDGGAPLPVAFIQVERYNLGPALHQMAVEDYGAENVADVEEFGVGPHVAWRLAFMPIMGNQAILLAAARTEISDPDAARTQCLDRTCLDAYALADELHAWQEIETPITAFASPYRAAGWDEVAVNARIAAELSSVLGMASIDGETYSWVGSEQPEAAANGTPYLFLLIDRDLGQDSGTDSIMALTALNDDSISEVWARRIEFPGYQYWQGLVVGR